MCWVRRRQGPLPGLGPWRRRRLSPPRAEVGYAAVAGAAAAPVAGSRLPADR